jgi:hypothetical protein
LLLQKMELLLPAAAHTDVVIVATVCPSQADTFALCLLLL